MGKKIKTTLTNLNVDVSNALIVEIGKFKFIKDECYPWIYILVKHSNTYEFLMEIANDDIAKIYSSEDLKIYVMNWYFNNVEIVKEGDIDESKSNYKK